MRALRFHGKEDLRLDDVDEPSPGPGEVKLRNAYTGICGTDLHVYFTPEASGFDFSKPNELTGAALPQVFGHEFAGTVVEVGAGVTGVAVDDRVAVWPLHGCGECPACRADRDHACWKLACPGISSPGGGMSTFTTVAADKVYVLPAGLDLKMGALVEPMATGWHAVTRSGAGPGRSAFVAGAGPIGIGLWFALRARGVERIVVAEPLAERREALTRLGAKHVVDATPEAVAAAVGEVSDGAGVDVAFEAAGVGAAVGQALATLTPQGTLALVGLHEKGFDFNPTPMIFAENTVVGCIAYRPDDFRAVIDAMAHGRYSTDGWVTTVPLEQAAQALRDLRAGKGMKILVEA